MQLITSNSKTGYCFNTICPMWQVDKDKRPETCRKCYAERIVNFRPNVKQACISRTKAALQADFVDKFVAEFERKRKPIKYFRWHSLGEIQNLAHLCALVEIARRLPKCKFWLPTRKVAIVNQYLKTNTLPDNLTIRISDGCNGLPKSVVSKLEQVNAHNCPATFGQDHTCEGNNCRACWDKSIDLVVYKQH